MGVSLEALPIELIEIIVRKLDLRDIACLRLTGRGIASRASASRGHFSRYFHRKQVVLHARRLDHLIGITRQSHLACHLRHLIIIGPVGLGRARTKYRAHEHVRLLAEVFRNLMINSPNGCLASLSLRVAVVSSCPDRIQSAEFWAVVRRTFKVTIAALDEANLPISEHLDLFGGATGYSLEYDAFVAFTQKLSLGSVFNHLKRLTLSLSSPLAGARPEYGNESESELEFNQNFAALDIDQHDEQDIRRYIDPDILAWDTQEGWKTQRAHSVSALGAVFQLPGIMPELESLSLHWNNTGKDASPSLVQHPADPNTTNSSAPLRLKECNLGGLYAPASGLLHFITSVRPERLTMKGIHLISGTYTSHLKYLTNPDTPTTCYRLDDMYTSGGRLIHFNIPGEKKFSYKNSTSVRLGPTTISQETSGVKHKDITYRIGPIDPGTVSYAYWLRNMMSEFGPPLRGCREFILPHELKNDVEIGYHFM